MLPSRRASLHEKPEEDIMTRSNVITGASKIIGMAAAEALAAAGWEVIRVARHTPANFDSLMLVRHGPFMPRRSGSQRRLHERRRVDRARQAETRSLTAHSAGWGRRTSPFAKSIARRPLPRTSHFRRRR
jgi:hypothetical protein